MVYSSSAMKNQGVEVSNVQLVKNDACPPPKFCVIPEICMKGDLMGVLSLIQRKFIMIMMYKVATCIKLEKLVIMRFMRHMRNNVMKEQ